MADLKTNSYQNSLIFIRDLFQYTIPGFIFWIVLYLAYHITIANNFFFTGSISVISMIVISYFAGKFSSSIADFYVKWILQLTNWLCNKVCKKDTSFYRIKNRTNEYIKLKYPDNIYPFDKEDKIDDNEENIYRRSFVYHKLLDVFPNLYLTRIERYNNIGVSHKTLSVLTIMFFFFSLYNIICNDFQISILIYLISSFILSFVFIYFYSRTEISSERLLVTMMEYEEQQSLIKIIVHLADSSKIDDDSNKQKQK